MNLNKKLCLSAVLSAVSSMSMAEESKKWPFPGEITGDISVLSSYDFRGMTNSPENNKATIQAGLEYNHPSGFYLGYWGSTLGYSLSKFDPELDEYTGRDAFEHDFNVGYRGQINDDWSYTVGGSYYYYYESDAKSESFETLLGLNYKDLELSAQTLTNNSIAGNRGDTYLQASYSHALPQDFTGHATLGAYYYNDSDKYVETTEDFGFRHLTLGVSHPLGNTGAEMNMDLIVAGYDRLNEKQKNKVVFGVKYAF